MCLAAIGCVQSVRREHGVLLAQVEVQGKVMTIGIDLTPEVEPGMHVVMHAGLAIQALTPEEAAEALALRADIAASAPDRPEAPD